MRNKILNSIVKVPGKESYAIKLDKNRECPLLCKDKLCFIQRNLGAEALYPVGQFYPRKLIKIEHLQLRLLSMTCPVAADIALFSINGMELESSCLGIENHNGWKLLVQTVKKKKDIDDVLAV